MILKNSIKILLPAAILAAVLLLPLTSTTQNISPEMIKAQYIIKMRPFISIGKSPHPIREICYYEKPEIPEDESVGQLIKKYLHDNPSKTGPISVKWFKAIRDFSGCDVFFIPEAEEGNIDNILAALDDSATLTISGANRFIYRGGMIGFVMDDESHVKMEVNLQNTKAKNITIRAEILELMLHVINQ